MEIMKMTVLILEEDIDKIKVFESFIKHFCGINCVDYELSVVNSYDKSNDVSMRDYDLVLCHYSNGLGVSFYSMYRNLHPQSHIVLYSEKETGGTSVDTIVCKKFKEVYTEIQYFIELFSSENGVMKPVATGNNMSSEETIERCSKIFISWQYALVFVGGLLAFIAGISWAGGTKIATMQSQLKEAQTNIAEFKTFYKSVDKKLDSLLKK
jgi:hypothetical protein